MMAPDFEIAARSGTQTRAGACVGITDHAGWAVAVTVTAAGEVLDRRRIGLLDAGLPVMPYHHQAQHLPLEEAIRLVEQVRICAARTAAASLATLAAEVAAPIGGIALRTCPALPDSIEERIRSYRARCVADWVVYRQALARAATARNWQVHWYDPRQVQARAARVLGVDSIDGLLKQAGARLGPPWQRDHRMAMAAAISAQAAEDSGLA